MSKKIAPKTTWKDGGKRKPSEYKTVLIRVDEFSDPEVAWIEIRFKKDSNSPLIDPSTVQWTEIPE